ncbi:MAG: hypothetical protein ACRDPY_19410 [Streptosporangiaceae bacterium]
MAGGGRRKMAQRKMAQRKMTERKMTERKPGTSLRSDKKDFEFSERAVVHRSLP